MEIVFHRRPWRLNTWGAVWSVRLGAEQHQEQTANEHAGIQNLRKHSAQLAADLIAIVVGFKPLNITAAIGTTPG